MRTVSKNLATRRSFFMFPANEVALLHALDPIFVLMAAYGLALLFAGAAISKLASLAEFEGVVQNFRLLPRPLVKPVAWLLAPTELTVALGLAATTTRPYAAFAAVLLLMTFAAAIAINLWRGRRIIDCGCFGSMLDQTLSWALVARNGALTALAAVMAASGPPIRPPHWFEIVTAFGGALTIIIAALTVSQLWSNSMALRAQPLGKRQR
jgi:uncharacterized membrane protein YphA (DoxX/SURF4 family)